MPNRDYPEPCPTCGAQGECEHRRDENYSDEFKEKKEQGRKKEEA